MQAYEVFKKFTILNMREEQDTSGIFIRKFPGNSGDSLKDRFVRKVRIIF